MYLDIFYSAPNKNVDTNSHTTFTSTPNSFVAYLRNSTTD